MAEDDIPEDDPEIDDPQIAQILDFWFSDEARIHWFNRFDAFDRQVGDILLPHYQAAVSGELDDWAYDTLGCLALIILLDQVPRNIFRDAAQAFATDEVARDIARYANRRGFDREVTDEQRLFFYLPLEHSEAIEDQTLCCALMRQMDNAEWIRYAERHREIIARFGRFPHRNAILGRPSTPEEIAFLQTPGSSF